ncbi:site-specific integrase [Vibrio cholerae]|uniref:site-specific integrase n=1 Tax=Vibrio cholerae TaxID=666 RepID=UPI00053CA94E|nr:site-specific integrase [Vibrio cholerae]
MYLFKHPSSVYYTRVNFPSSLQKKGYPTEKRISLLTKERKLAIIRNLEMTAHLKGLFIDLLKDPDMDFYTCSTSIDTVVETLRSNYREEDQNRYYASLPAVQDDIQLPRHIDLQDERTYLQTVSPSYHFRRWLAQFIQSKSTEGVVALTTHQLQQRVSHFLDYLDREELSEPSTGDMLSYIDHLRSEGRSAKTNKDYFASTKQFLSWCTIKEFILVNPAQSLKPSFKNTKHASDQRERWSIPELHKFFLSEGFKEQSEDFQWISYLQLFGGFRTQEPCQLYTNDVICDDAIPYISVADYYPYQHLKNQHAVRYVPIHPYLIERGFLDFVRSRKTATNQPLFHYTPQGKDNDWSKLYRTQFGKLQTRLGMKVKQRPTAYSLRHTFIDELKQLDEPEHRVAEIVGHVNPHMTFGRYGKKAQLDKQFKIVSKMQIVGLSC